ncbi:Histidinol-phosphate aminotransferase [Marinomonas spartinae]|uniref:pyridoxal phosphate-dependent aminotransferase n=1 Tax=Marinomonas spartinae TaxID=1792290 RepID=UPI000808B519|nr:histidinol-phosphate transaminase [Marinomonas spartinae]SBS27174.1 Histidinol-phosphate aminotransferase [Marinomonas spartinae]
MKIVNQLVRNDMVVSKAYAAPDADQSKIGLHLNENLLMSKDYSGILMDGLNVEDLCLYPYGNDLQMREAVAKRHGVDVSQIFTNNGSSAIIQQIFYASLTNEECILTVDPTWLYYSSLAANIGAKTHLSPLIHNQKEFFFDIDDLIAKANTLFPKIIVICSPNNPTGNLISVEDVKRLCLQVPEGTMVLLDEAYSDFFESNECIVGSLIRDHENLVVIKTFSKAFGLAGIRVGYGVCNASLAEFICKDRPAFGISILSQKIVANALKFGGEHMQGMRRELALSSRYLVNTLAEFKEWHLYNSSCNFVLIRHDYFSGNHISTILKQHNYLVKELVVAGNPNYIRLTLPPLDMLKKVVDLLLSIGKEKSKADEMAAVQIADHNDWEKII